MKHRPCGDCPWRLDAPLGKWDREHFESMAKDCHGDGWRIMGCHKGGDIICAGWAAVEGFEAIGVRLATLSGLYNPRALDVRRLPLFPSMRAMIDANNVAYVKQGLPPVAMPDREAELREWIERAAIELGLKQRCEK